MLKRIKNYFQNLRAFRASQRAVHLKGKDGLKRWVLHIEGGFNPYTRKRMKEMVQKGEVGLTFQQLKSRAIFVTK